MLGNRVIAVISTYYTGFTVSTRHWCSVVVSCDCHVTFLLQSDRFKDELSETPGPGAYVVSKPSDWLRKTYPPKKKQAGSNEVRHNLLICIMH